MKTSSKKLRSLMRVVFIFVLIYFVTYTVIVTPARFLQCLTVPFDTFSRYPSVNHNGNLPPAVDGNQIELLVNGSDVLPRLLEMINSAENTIRWQVMLFDPDEIGMQLGNALAGAADRGVDVYISFDLYQTVNGSVAAPYSEETIELFHVNMEHLLARFASAGVVFVDNTGGIGYDLTNIDEQYANTQTHIQSVTCVEANHLDHRKLFIVDDQAIIGGMNVGRQYLYFNEPNLTTDMRDIDPDSNEPWEKWFDTAMYVRGPIVESVIEEFDWRWYVMRGPEIDSIMSFEPITGNDILATRLHQYPGTLEISTSYVQLIDGAESEIYIGSPYISHDYILERLEAAAQRGVTVRLFFPGRYNDVEFSRVLFRGQMENLLEAGVEIYENNLRMTHTKMMIVDRRYIQIGSFNINFRSVMHDLETNLLIDSHDVATEAIERIFEPYQQIADRVTEGYDTAPFWYWFITPFT